MASVRPTDRVSIQFPGRVEYAHITRCVLFTDCSGWCGCMPVHPLAEFIKLFHSFVCTINTYLIKVRWHQLTRNALYTEKTKKHITNGNNKMHMPYGRASVECLSLIPFLQWWYGAVRFAIVCLCMHINIKNKSIKMAFANGLAVHRLNSLICEHRNSNNGIYYYFIITLSSTKPKQLRCELFVLVFS